MVDLSGDLSNGEITQSGANNISEELEDQKQKRKFRLWLFYPFGFLSFCMFVGLFCELTRLLTYNDLVITSSVQDWHSSLLLVAILIIYASVPLSIVISLMRMTSSAKDKNNDDPLFTSPQIEFIKNVIGLVSNAKS
ncbi:hypothetical protein A0J51_00960 [Gluconobacter japonicus]|nr:hypothetical protein A0J51_00960 [Gluconobacter japonicus]